jgi:hypothetical protein
MSLKRGVVNPLSVLGLRKLNFIPAHFEKVSISKIIDTQSLDHWINYNLNGRYAITKELSFSDNKIVEILEIGFEDPKEITMLTLGCPYLHG